MKYAEHGENKLHIDVREDDPPEPGMVRVTAKLMAPGQPDESQEVWCSPGLLRRKEEAKVKKAA